MATKKNVMCNVQLKISLLAICLLFCATTFAQYKVGYVISLQGDTIHGLVSKKPWLRTPREVDFKSDERSELKSFTSRDISGFRVDEYLFKSARVNIDRAEIKTAEFLSNNPAPEFVEETVFLQYLFKGVKSLLFLKDDKDKEHFYIQDETSNIEPLVYKKYLQGSVVTENAEYKNQLLKYFKGLSTSELETLEYSSDSLTKLFRTFYQKPKTFIQYEAPQKVNSRIYLTFNLGVVYTQLKFSGSATAYFRALDRTDFTSSTSGTAGASLDMYSRSGVGFSTGLAYTNYASSGSDELTGTDSYFRFNYLSLQFAAIYKFSRTRNGFYIFGGGTLGKVLASEVGYPDFKVKEIEAGYFFGTGYQFKYFQIEAKREQTTGMSNFINLGSDVVRYYLLVKVPLSLERK